MCEVFCLSYVCVEVMQRCLTPLLAAMQYDRRNSRIGFATAPCQEIGTGQLVLDPCDPTLLDEARSVSGSVMPSEADLVAGLTVEFTLL